MQPFTVACCQLRAHDLDAAELSLTEMLEALDEAGRLGAQLVALPECSYPAYYLRDSNPYARPGVRPFAEVAALLGAKAKEHGYWLAAGIAVPHADGRLTNSGLVFAPDGALRGRYDKSFLWHFDNDWFSPGREFPVFDAAFCRFGILICADGRLPEIARSLAVNGAEVILDLTAWVSWGRSTAELTTTQCEYLMPARAFENGVWVAAAGKWGSEDGTIVYAGRSSVIDPHGVTRVCGPSDRSTVVAYEIEPVAVDLVARRPSLYGALTAPTESLPAAALLRQPLVPADEGARVAVVPGNGAFDARQLVARYESLRRQDASLAVFGGCWGPGGWEVDLPIVEAAVRQLGGAAAFAVESDGCAGARSAVLVTPQATHQHVATHGRGVSLGELPAPVVPTAAGNVALLCGEEGFVPEVARSLVLQGAEVLAWPSFGAHPMLESVARTRSDENFVYTAAAWPDGGIVVSPAGSLLTAVPAGSGIAMTASTNRAFTRWKERAPNTDVISGRIPEAYGALTRPAG